MMRQTGREEDRGLRIRDLPAIAAAAWGLVLAAAACDGRDVRVGEVPLGWGGTIEAREVRLWTAESLESAPRWRVGVKPFFEVVPDSVQVMVTGMEHPDGSLVLSRSAGTTDTTLVASIVAADPMEAGNEPSDSQEREVLFTTAVQRDPNFPQEVPMRFAHQPSGTAGVSGDTIWIVPTERPELLAVHRSGRILLKVEWDAGDRSVPAGAPPAWEGIDRFPATTDLRVGADGLIYVERVAVREGRLMRGPEWLVFSPAGELMGRLDVPGRFPSFRVLAFGDGALVARARDEKTRVQEVRVYRFSKSE